jgi:hypothetical protein
VTALGAAVASPAVNVGTGEILDVDTAGGE